MSICEDAAGLVDELQKGPLMPGLSYTYCLQGRCGYTFTTQGGCSILRTSPRDDILAWTSLPRKMG